MDKKALIGWLVGIAARGLAWVFAAKLGLDAAEARSEAAAAAEAVGSLVLVAVSVYSSVTGRRRLLAQTPPKQ